MRQDDFAAFRALMAGMAKVYEREIDSVLLDAYWLALSDWEIGEFAQAAGELMRTSEFMPRPAAFNELRKRARHKSADEAWFTRGISDDPRANRAMKIATQGRYVGHIPTDELPWVQKRFKEAYEELADIEEARAAIGTTPHERIEELGARERRLGLTKL